jgi:mono/diheme cytochrome c family protein
MGGAVAIIIGVAASGLLRTQEAPASPAVLALGDSVFHGKAGGALCYVCHGPAGKGIAGLGPNLADKEWVNGDGSLPFIERVVLDGVPKPRKMPAPMPPKGGGQLNESQIKAVAAYVYSLSRTTK